MYKPLIIKTPQQKLDGGITNQEQAGYPLRWSSSDKQVTCKWDHIYVREVMKVTPWILCVPLNHKPLQRKYGIHWWSTSQTQSPGTQEGLERLFGTSVNAYNTSTRHEHQLHILPICETHLSIDAVVIAIVRQEKISTQRVQLIQQIQRQWLLIGGKKEW